MMQSVADAEAQTEAAYTGAIRALAAALDARDPYTAGHSERVSVISVAIGRVLKLPDADLEVLRLGALLHDIGKIGVPDESCASPVPLTPAEYDIIKQHPVLGARILRPVPVSGAAHSDRGAAPRTAGRPRIPARPARRRHPARRARGARRGCLRRDDQRPRLPEGDARGRRPARAVAMRRHGVSRGDRRRAGHGASWRHLRHAAKLRCGPSVVRRTWVAIPFRAACGRPVLPRGLAHDAGRRAQSLARFSLDSAVAVDLFQGQNASDRPNIVIDVTAVVRLADGLARSTSGPGSGSRGRRSGTRRSIRRPCSTRATGAISTRVDVGLPRVADRPGHARHAARHQPGHRHRTSATCSPCRPSIPARRASRRSRRATLSAGR